MDVLSGNHLHWKIRQILLVEFPADHVSLPEATRICSEKWCLNVWHQNCPKLFGVMEKHGKTLYMTILRGIGTLFGDEARDHWCRVKTHTGLSLVDHDAQASSGYVYIIWFAYPCEAYPNSLQHPECKEFQLITNFKWQRVYSRGLLESSWNGFYPNSRVFQFWEDKFLWLMFVVYTPVVGSPTKQVLWFPELLTFINQLLSGMIEPKSLQICRKHS